MTNSEYYKIASEMKMRLNELSQKLHNNDLLCSQVAHLIDLTIESKDLISYVSQIHSEIPTMQKKLNNLIQSCSNDVLQCQTDTINNILVTLTKLGRSLPENYIPKIKKTISYCIDNYDVYRTSNYAIKYGKNHLSSDKLSIPQILDL